MNITDIVAIILGGVFAGLIGALCGRARGCPVAGFWWGFFLNAIGWLIVLLGADLRPKCPECRGVIEEGAARCKNCGVEFGVAEREPVVSRLQVPNAIPRVKAHVPAPNIHHPRPKVRAVIQIMIIGLAFLFSISSVYSADHQLVITVRGQPQQTKKKIAYQSTDKYLTDTDIAKTLALEIAIRNAAAKSDTCVLSWFFISKSLTSDDRRIYDQGGQTCEIKATDAIKIIQESKPIIRTESAFGDGDVWKRGEKIEGYVVFVKDETGKLISLKSANTKLDALAKDPEKWAELLKTVPQNESAGSETEK